MTDKECQAATSSTQTNHQTIKSLTGGVFSLSFTPWVLLGFFIVFFVDFIYPTFLSAYHEFRLFPNFPVLKPLGADLHEFLNFSRHMLETGSPYIQPNYYPPFQAIFFLPLLRPGPDQSFIYLTILSLICFLTLIFCLPALVEKKHQLRPLALFGVVSGLFSYGLWFELERGQFDLLVMGLCFGGIYLYHFYPRWRWLAFALFIMSVNIKIYPVVFILCFTRDWRDWKSNLIRWGLLLIANFAGLFILGWQVFLDFLQALTSQLGNPTYWWAGNHSADSFVRVMVESMKDSQGVVAPLRANIRWLVLGLQALYLFCLGGVLIMVYRRRMSAANPYLLLMLTLGTMVLPSTSHDYKLSLLVSPVILLLNQLEFHRSGRVWLDSAAIVLVTIFSAAYSSTLFLHNDLPVWLTNNLPALLIMAAATVFLMMVRVKQNQQTTCQEFDDLA